jgi:gamma-glutamyltranspeptidase/glutathione hydrolase
MRHHAASPRITVLRGGRAATPGGLLYVLLLCLLCLPTTPAPAAETTPPAAAIATAHPLATQAGHDILQAGGNAFDAAVAVGAMLAVVEPSSSGLGGGGFWLLHRATDGREVMLDGRERAPLAARPDMYLDETGAVIPRLSIDGARAAAIPGTPAALDHLTRHYGRLPLKQTLAPAIRAARDGFRVNAHYLALARFRHEALRRSAAAAAIFLDKDAVPGEDFVLRQPDLARVLEAIAEHGRDGFYAGPVAERLIDGARAAGGIWSRDDLADYRVIEREPVRGEYRGIRITAAAPPSSGGIALVTMLNILAGYPLDELEDSTRTHLIIEAMRRAYRDRAVYLGDPDFVDIPAALLLHPFYAAGLRNAIRPDRATPSETLPGVDAGSAGNDTTHFSILDRDGNRVAATLSINLPFGAAFVAPGTGVLLNNEMDDFSVKPGVGNAYGLIGAEPNAIAAGKRPLSSMTPIFLDDGQRLAIVGTPGGSRIISMVLLAALEFSRGSAPEQWVAGKRFHHQYLPDVVSHEAGAFDADAAAALTARGHRLEERARPYGNMQAILWDRARDRVLAASDPRGGGGAMTR